jgi:hypothetical protein
MNQISYRQTLNFSYIGKLFPYLFICDFKTKSEYEITSLTDCSLWYTKVDTSIYFFEHLYFLLNVILATCNPTSSYEY